MFWIKICKRSARALFWITGFLPMAAEAWTFSPSPQCRLFHETPSLQVVLTFEPELPEYTISLTRRDGQWRGDYPFQITFQGDRPFTISTTRQELTANGRTLTVRDSGFGNVLLGLGSSPQAIAQTGPAMATIPLEDIEPALAAFRACPAPATS